MKTEEAVKLAAGKKGVEKFYNDKFYPFGAATSIGTQRTIVARVEAEDAALWAGKPTYIEVLQCDLDRKNFGVRCLVEPKWLSIIRKIIGKHE